jgi:hypothetical protein
LVAWFNVLNPAVHAQGMLNAIARTELADYLRYQEAIPVFHANVSEFYRIRLFRNQSLSKQDYAQLPRFTMPEPDAAPISRWSFLLVPALGLLMGLWGLVRLKRQPG